MGDIGDNAWAEDVCLGESLRGMQTPQPADGRELPLSQLRGALGQLATAASNRYNSHAPTPSELLRMASAGKAQTESGEAAQVERVRALDSDEALLDEFGLAPERPALGRKDLPTPKGNPLSGPSPAHVVDGPGLSWAEIDTLASLT